MSIVVLFFSLILGISLESISVENKMIEKIIDEAGKPSATLQEILKITDIGHCKTLKDAVTKTQKPESNWLRPVNKERWEVVDHFSSKKDQLMPLFKSLGLLNDIAPSKESYDIVIVTGGISESFFNRFSTLEKLLKSEKIKIKEIVILTGERLIDKEKDIKFLNDKFGEKNKKEIDDIKTETDVARFLLNDRILFSEINKLKITIVDTPGKKNSEGKHLRPTTESTIKFWIEKYKTNQTESILAVSSQPFVKYQHSVLKTFLPESFSLETIGEFDTRGETDTVSLYLDTLARTLYQEDKRLNQKK